MAAAVSSSILFAITFGLAMVAALLFNTGVSKNDLAVTATFTVIAGLLHFIFASALLPVFIVSVLGVLWVLLRMFYDRGSMTEKVLSGAISLSLSFHYLLFYNMITGITTGDKAIIPLSTYTILLSAAVFIVYKRRIFIFRKDWLKDFFYNPNVKIRRHRYVIIWIFILIIVITMTGLYIVSFFSSIFINDFLFIVSGVFIALTFWLLKFFVEYYIMIDVHNINAQYQQELELFNEVIRTQRHDFNHHLHAIKGMLDSKRHGECSEYVSDLVKETVSVNSVLPISNPTVSAMLYTFDSQAQRLGINFCVEIHYNLENISTKPYETNKILGNLIQNAIDDVEASGEREYGVNINISCKNGKSVIDVSNVFRGDPEIIGKIFGYKFSTKKGHDGIGLNSVLRIAESYGGILYSELSGDIIHFIVMIPNKR